MLFRSTFGLPCIKFWLDSGRWNSNTCSLDRYVLYQNSNALDGQMLPWNTPRERRQEFVTLIQRGETVGDDGILTREGCRRYVIDLWICTGDYLILTEQENITEEVNDESLLSRPIHDALPPGIDITPTMWQELLAIS